MSTLHDRIAALADEWERQATDVRAGMYGSGMDDAVNTLDNAARRLRAVLAETANADECVDDCEDREALASALHTFGDGLFADEHRVPWVQVSHAARRYRLAQANAVLAAGFRRSRPEATHTVTAEQVVEKVRTLLLAPRPMGGEFYRHTGGYATELDALRDLYDDEFADNLAGALGVTVADTPTQGGGDA